MKVIIMYLAELFLGYKYPKSKKVALFSVILMWILYSFNIYSGDYTGYNNLYSDASIDFNSNGFFTFGNVEPGWTLLMAIPIITKMTFYGFRIFAGTLYTVLLYGTVKKYTENIALALSIFSIFPFTHSMSVLRFGYASLIFAFFAASFIKGNTSTKSKLLFCLGTVLASMFHYSMILFLIFILLSNKFGKKELLLASLGIVSLFILLKTDIPYNFFTAINVSRFSILARNWLSHNTAPGKLSLGMFAIGYILDFYVSYLASKKNPDSDFSKNVNRMYMLSVVFVPLVLTTDQFTRLYFVLFLFNICSAVNTLNVCCQGEGNKLSIKKLITDPYIVVLFVAIAKFLLSDFVYFGTENEGIRCLGQNFLLNLI